MGKRAKRRTKQFALSISVLLFSAALALTAVLIPIGSSGSALAKVGRPVNEIWLMTDLTILLRHCGRGGGGFRSDIPSLAHQPG